jgi:DNA repair protein RecO (recombination protein O)
MKFSRTYKTDAVIIKRIKLGEADRIVTLYTPEYGKIKAITKGTRRPKSKLGGHVELLTYSSLFLAKGRNLDIVTQAQTIESFLTLKNDLRAMAFGLYVTELLDSFTIENDVNREIFELLVSTLQRITEGKNKETALRYFELHLLDQIGYRPQLQYCSNCNKTLQPLTNYFCSNQGGALCRNCSYEEPITKPISLNALKVLRLWQNCTYDSAVKVNVNPELALELEQIMREYIKYLLERQVKSVTWLDTLKR